MSVNVSCCTPLPNGPEQSTKPKSSPGADAVGKLWVSRWMVHDTVLCFLAPAGGAPHASSPTPVIATAHTIARRPILFDAQLRAVMALPLAALNSGKSLIGS